jgi:hypothetical protein
VARRKNAEQLLEGGEGNADVAPHSRGEVLVVLLEALDQIHVLGALRGRHGPILHGGNHDFPHRLLSRKVPVQPLHRHDGQAVNRGKLLGDLVPGTQSLDELAVHRVHTREEHACLAADLPVERLVER